MKRIFFLFLLIYSHWSFGQLDFKNSNVGRLMDYTDLEGHSLLKKYDPAVTGSPFLIDHWIPAKITLSGGKDVGPVQVKFNIESNELHFLDSTKKEMIAGEGVVKRVEGIDIYAKDSLRYIFKNGYPAIDGKAENYFYQVFTEGRIELLAKKFKYIATEKNDLTGDLSKSFVDGIVVWYVYAYGVIQPLKSNKSFISSLWDEKKQQEMNNYISANKINFKNTSDLIKLFTYYDSLK